MRKFTRKPEAVEAVQFIPNNKPWPLGVWEIKPYWSSKDRGTGRYSFRSGEAGGLGSGAIYPGDWVVYNTMGQQFIVREKDFWGAYEEVK